ncbi:hypothetical protein BC830DRAFT_1125684 [Chytriomyces sp. MP71]|nr:hypothetical protein BC830DRAFT_1125684 [Chytriomyces sp. MP71]
MVRLNRKLGRCRIQPGKRRCEPVGLACSVRDGGSRERQLPSCGPACFEGQE